MGQSTGQSQQRIGKTLYRSEGVSLRLDRHGFFSALTGFKSRRGRGFWGRG